MMFWLRSAPKHQPALKPSSSLRNDLRFQHQRLSQTVLVRPKHSRPPRPYHELVRPGRAAEAIQFYWGALLLGPNLNPELLLQLVKQALAGIALLEGQLRDHDDGDGT